MKLNDNERARCTSIGRLVSILAPFALLLTGSNSSEAAGLDRFILAPTKTELQPDGRYPYSLPNDYKFHQGCGPTPIGMGEVKDGDTSFNAQPLPAGSELGGFTLRIWNGQPPEPTPQTVDSSCTTIQILLLHPKAEMFGQLPGNWQLPLGKPREGHPPGKAKSIFDVDDVPTSTPPARPTVFDLDPPLPETAWVFATSTAPAELRVKLPTIDGKQQAHCDNGQPSETFTFKTERERTIQISPDGKDCSSTKEQKIVLLINDALGLAESERKSLSASARIEPIDDQTIQIWIPGLFAQRPELQHNRNFILPLNKSVGSLEWGHCRSVRGCPLMIRNVSWEPGDGEMDVKLSTPASRYLEKRKLVYGDDGKPLERASVLIDRVKGWIWPQNRIPVPVKKIAPDKRTPIVVDNLAAHMVPLGKELSCRYREKGTDKTIAKCAVLRKEDAKEHALYLEHPDAQKVLGASDATLFVDLPESIEWLDGTNKDKTVSFELSTDDCAYTFTQLTETVAGMRSGEVLYWATSEKNANTCLRAPIKVESMTSDVSARVELGATEWTDQEKKEGAYTEEQGRVLQVRLAAIPDGATSAAYPLVAKFGRDKDAPVVPLRGGADSFDLHVNRGIDDREMTIDIELAGEDSPAVLANQPHLAVDRTNRLYLASSMSRPWRVRLLSLSNHARVAPSPSFGIGSIVVSDDPRVLASATADGRTAYFLDGTVPTETDLKVRAELEGTVSQFLRSEGKRVISESKLDRIRNNSIKLGYVEKTLRDKKTKVFRLPWDLREAELRCTYDGKETLIRSSTPTRGLKPNEYRECKIHVRNAEQPIRRQLKMDGNAELNWGPQQLVVVAIKNGGPQETEIARLNQGDFNPPNPQDKQAAKPPCRKKCFRSEPSEQGSALIANIDTDVLRKLGDVPSYTELQIVVRHVQPSDSTLGAQLKGAFIPDELDVARASELRARTRLLPGGAKVWTNDTEGLSWGHRLYVSGAANLSLYQSSDPGVGSIKSSAYEGAIKAKFGYGVLGTFEPWNFSDNKPWLPIFSPQVNLGFFGPTDLEQPRVWRQFAVVYGLTFRLPAASTPKPETTEAQTGLIAWGRLTIGDRGEVMNSLLLGVNVAIGAAP